MSNELIEKATEEFGAAEGDHFAQDFGDGIEAVLQVALERCLEIATDIEQNALGQLKQGGLDALEVSRQQGRGVAATVIRQRIKALIGAQAGNSEAAITPLINPAPIDMLLFCPKCNAKHIDKPQPEKNWGNPPHRSHECQFCGTVWRPSDSPTNGVAFINTRGKRDIIFLRRKEDEQ